MDDLSEPETTAYYLSSVMDSGECARRGMVIIPEGRRYWYCCLCGDGPNNVDVVTKCIRCEHIRCMNCRAYQVSDPFRQHYVHLFYCLELTVR